jgi:tetratricopeptide (TPR) repeat protein
MSYANKLISTEGSLEVVPAGSIIGLADNFGWSGDLDDPANTTLLSKLRQVYGATHVLAMELKSDSGALRMNYALLSPDDSQHKGTIVGDGGTDLAYGVVQAVYGYMLRKSHQGGEIPLVSEDSFNNEAFARGMALSLQGRCADAVPFFEVIIEQEPGLFAPRFEYAACLRILGESEQAETLLISLVEEQRVLGTSRPLAQTLMTLGILYNRTGRLDLAQQAYEEALLISEDISDHILKARILQNLSIVYKDKSKLKEAGDLLDLAMLAYQDAGREILPGQLYSGRANLKMARGELVEAEVDLAMALKAFREIGDRRNEAMMLNNTGYLKRRQGRMEEAEDYHLRSLEIREEIGDRVGVGRIYGMLSGVYAARGQYRDAINAAESAREIATETHDRLFEATSLAQLAAANKSLGEYASARKYYFEGRAIFIEIQDIKRRLQTDLKIAQLDLIENHPEQAQSTALQTLETSREHGIMPTEVQALELLGDIEISRGNIAAAIIELNEALTRVRETTWASKENTLETKLANAYLDQVDLEAAAPLVGALTGQPPNVQSLKVQARFAFLRGDADAAVRLMSEAKTLAGENWADESESALQKYQAK